MVTYFGYYFHLHNFFYMDNLIKNIVRPIS